MKILNNKQKILLVIFTCVYAVFTVFSPTNATDQILNIHFLDVGQADSIIIQLPNKQIMVIDGGNNLDGKLIIDYLHQLGIEKIDYLIGTHPHEDHIGGLDDLIKTFSIGKIYLPKVLTTTKTFEDLLLAIKEKNLKITSAQRGMKIIDQHRLQAVIFAPNETIDYSNLNNWSMVVKLTFEETSFLFTGDAETESELEMLHKKCHLQSDLLKVGHHGSGTSSSERFLQAVSPTYAIISVGSGNNYGHPAKSVLDRLQKHGILFYRTDQQGTIIASSDGRKITFNQQAIAATSHDDFSVVIVGVDLVKEVVTIENTSMESRDISNWQLVSLQGNQSFIFPPGTIIQPGQNIQITSGKNAQSSNNTFIWTYKYIWNNNGDPAALYDVGGNLISEYGGI